MVKGRVGHLLSIGGHRFTAGLSTVHQPTGLPVRVREDAALAAA
jgi:hypothetical protein